jgi:hypothetical protein
VPRGAKRRRKPATSGAASNPARNVFINCPFDEQYSPLFRAAIFAVMDCGFKPRTAMEVDDSSEIRIEKICRIIADCRYGIHDLSRTELDPTTRLPRFNMPLELGIFLGAKRFGDDEQSRKNGLVLDTERYRYQQFISDISGQDIYAHGGQVDRLITAVRNWLKSASRRKSLPGGASITDRFRKFESDLPMLCHKLQISVGEVTYPDFVGLAATWLDEYTAVQRTVSP